METAYFLRVAASLSAFVAAAFALPGLVDQARYARAARLVRESVRMRGGRLAQALRNGIPVATALARRLARHPKLALYFSDVRWFAQQRGYETTDANAGGVAIAAACAVLPVGWVLSPSPVFGLMLSACLLIGLGIAARQARERDREAMREAVPDMLHTMSACFNAGYSLMQSFRHLAKETQGPLQKLFRRAESDLETGCTASEALQRMRDDSSLPELSFVTAALEIQHRTGGSLQKIIESACESVEGELALRRSLRVQTAQARLSMRVVTIMPFVLIAVFSFVSPEFLSPFFATPLGMAVFSVAMGMQAAGVLTVRRMLDVKED